MRAVYRKAMDSETIKNPQPYGMRLANVSSSTA